jgi:hypothetical protein
VCCSVGECEEGEKRVGKKFLIILNRSWKGWKSLCCAQNSEPMGWASCLNMDGEDRNGHWLKRYKYFFLLLFFPFLLLCSFRFMLACLVSK